MKKSQILEWFALSVFIVIIPIFLFLSAIELRFSSFRTLLDAELEQRLLNAISKFEEFEDDRVFFHVFLQKLFLRADGTGDPSVFSKRVKSVFRNKVKLIVWDNRGNVIKTISDEKKFSYVLGKMWQAIKQIKMHCQQNRIPAPQKIPFLAKNITTLRHYFGEFLVSEIMARPLFEGTKGQALFVSNDKDKGFLWYQTGKNFSVACFLSRDLKHKNIGLESLCNQNNQKSEVKTGFVNVHTGNISFPGQQNIRGSDFLIAIEKFFLDGSTFQENKNFTLAFNQVSPGVLIFSSIERSWASGKRNEYLAKTVSNVLKCVFLLLFTAFCYSLRLRAGFPIRSRMFLILLFSSGLPIAFIVSSCYEYFSFHKRNLVFTRHNESMGILRTFDERYPEFLKKLAKEQNNFINDLNNLYGCKKWPEEGLGKLKSKMESLSASEFGLFKPVAGCYYYGGEKNDKKSNEHLNKVFSSILEALNSTKTIKKSYINLDFGGFAHEAYLVADILDNVGKMSQRTFGSDLRIGYINLLGDQKNYNCWAISMIAWSLENMQRFYITNELKKMNREINPGKSFVVENFSGRLFPEIKVDSNSLKRFLKKVDAGKFSFEDNFLIAGEEYVLTAMVGNQLFHNTLILAYPKNLLFSELENFKKKIIFGITILTLLTMFVAIRVLALMFNPLKEIETGLKKVGKRNFTQRIESSLANEMGELVCAFNHCMESMGDLSLAASVQEALLPPGEFSGPFYEIFANSMFMTSMGGDFYDYNQLDEENLDITFGDVAGHGVPAALVMAMIKANTAVPESTLSPAEFLENCNQVLLFLKEKKLRKMMTLLNVRLNFKNGAVVLANAGHCFPIMIKNGVASFISAKGFPLGNKFSKNYEEVIEKLSAGDTFILYSDGFVEATNAFGEPFGFERFLTRLELYSSNGIQEIYNLILQDINSWAESQNDDLSILILRLKNGNI